MSSKKQKKKTLSSLLATCIPVPTGSCPSNIAYAGLARTGRCAYEKPALATHNEKPKQKSRKTQNEATGQPESGSASLSRCFVSPGLSQLMYVVVDVHRDPRDLRLCADATAFAAFSVARVANVFCHALSACPPRYENVSKIKNTKPPQQFKLKVCAVYNKKKRKIK